MCPHRCRRTHIGSSRITVARRSNQPSSSSGRFGCHRSFVSLADAKQFDFKLPEDLCQHEEKELHHLAGSMPLKDMAICGWKDDRRRVDSEAASYLQQTRTCSMSLQTLRWRRASEWLHLGAKLDLAGFGAVDESQHAISTSGATRSASQKKARNAQPSLSAHPDVLSLQEARPEPASHASLLTPFRIALCSTHESTEKRAVYLTDQERERRKRHDRRQPRAAQLVRGAGQLEQAN